MAYSFDPKDDVEAQWQKWQEHRLAASRALPTAVAGRPARCGSRPPRC